MQTQPRAVSTTSKKADTRRHLAQAVQEAWQSARENAMLALALSGHNDPEFVQTTTECDAIIERVREKCGIDLALDLEAAVNAHVCAAEDAVIRAWLRSRGSIPVTF